MEVEWWYHISEGTDVCFSQLIDVSMISCPESLSLLCNFGQYITHYIEL